MKTPGGSCGWLDTERELLDQPHPAAPTRHPTDTRYLMDTP